MIIQRVYGIAIVAVLLAGNVAQSQTPKSKFIPVRKLNLTRIIPRKN